MAASFNKTIIVGTLGSDPQIKYTTGGTAVCELSLAVNRQWVDKSTNQKKEECTWVPVSLWGRTAEVAGEYLHKGSQILIEGRLQMDSWTDAATGQKRTKLKVVGEQMTMLGGRSGGGERQQDGSEPQQTEPQAEPSYSGGGDEVPF